MKFFVALMAISFGSPAAAQKASGQFNTMEKVGRLAYDELSHRIDGANKESFTAADLMRTVFWIMGKWNHAKEAFGFGTRSGGTMGKTQ
ncbi:hypothetical protein [Desulfosarcina sp.]|uniref:hypothetical protein n=1 Tax=Desulfosarcina sp. TaxID=2027861 RepID=UPI0029AA9891|nr:hypothetical protein [Desulfosarcina sp.]MDX2492403.1 hypothetical protein [Desulfosarcina sp.]